VTTAESNPVGFRFATPNRFAHRIDYSQLYLALPKSNRLQSLGLSSGQVHQKRVLDVNGLKQCLVEAYGSDFRQTIVDEAIDE